MSYDLNDLYGRLFERAPDAGGQRFWAENGGQWFNQPGHDNGGVHGLERAMLASAAPADAATYMRSQHGGMNLYGPHQHMDWSGYMTRAAQQDRGINNMPFTFADYGALDGMPQEQVTDTFFRSPEELQSLLDQINAAYGTNSGLGGLGAGAPMNKVERERQQDAERLKRWREEQGMA